MSKSNYQNLLPTLKTELGLKSVSAVPKIMKVVVNVGVGKLAGDTKAIGAIADELKRITGQLPVITKAKQSIAGFKVREGDPVGVKITLRGGRMHDFLDKLVQVALPRVRDFQGLNPSAGFDGRGGYTLGLTEHVVFPEIVFENIDKVFSLEISIVTTAKNQDQTRHLLRALGFPFQANVPGKGERI
ncbi:TPA: 50S ribosomal protein L5 [Patescibacteria group bacterium]|uniref:Large ribosomal subunit protein uL5 n=2 Tax=Bacteria division Kazan-3B-28 TaxID=1798534 RepID=A0A0G1X6Y0_UNCK3|nr:MAG: 50S ribosomal protein L5, large subunit ribosomal protein L5 [candidate division Kazan bacterium GW2011_GWA1_50_15]KKW25410.1 MAG: 50S ribosomal protein L5 [candidate division Kazan bacterium GW2011_GWC1_52_13]KKW26716.1 MAG: 50S ribosomal protein L5 [candidate division Kazan bacterium GW2011_GWB1_52_7]HAV65713.1 50S ribosomal protein L5 [Patescibacteria group bacterium]HCL47575.1 50S ribosomal protein L5 [Patescibacteria group bacterium]